MISWTTITGITAVIVPLAAGTVWISEEGMWLSQLKRSIETKADKVEHKQLAGDVRLIQRSILNREIRESYRELRELDKAARQFPPDRVPVIIMERQRNVRRAIEDAMKERAELKRGK